MAAAGTLMLGDEAAEAYSEDEGFVREGQHGIGASVPGFAAAADDVFGGDSPRTARQQLQPERSVRQQGGSRNHSGTGALQQPQQHHVATAVMHQEGEQLGLEEIDDVDALIEAELAAKNALPGDLAAKLAAFEAMADEDE
jgi:hypothetical protein